MHKFSNNFNFDKMLRYRLILTSFVVFKPYMPLTLAYHIIIIGGFMIMSVQVVCGREKTKRGMVRTLAYCLLELGLDLQYLRTLCSDI